MTGSLRYSGDSKQNKLGTMTVYVESKSQVRALGRKSEMKSLK